MRHETFVVWLCDFNLSTIVLSHGGRGATSTFHSVCKAECKHIHIQKEETKSGRSYGGDYSMLVVFLTYPTTPHVIS
jgi:hypothetical protein